MTTLFCKSPLFLSEDLKSTPWSCNFILHETSKPRNLKIASRFIRDFLDRQHEKTEIELRREEELELKQRDNLESIKVQAVETKSIFER